MPLNLQTLMPAVVTPYTQTIVTDIDGDGLNEVIVFDDTILQLAIVHQFHYTDFNLTEINSTVWPNSTTPIWTTDTSPHYWTKWASQQATVPGGWTISPGDAIVAADLDGDGIAELFIYNLTTSTFGVLKWQTSTSQLQTIYKTSGANNLGAVGSQYFVIPNLHGIIPAVPANVAGILYYNAQTLAMGMFSYSASEAKFVSWWTHTGSSLFGWNLGASSPPANQFYPGFFQTAGTPNVVVYDPADAFIAVLQWNGTDFASGGGAGHNVGGWSFGSTDQLQCADLDGDGLTEILIYNPGTQYLGILEWDNTKKNLQAPVVINGTITNGSNSWTIGGNDKYYCLNQAPGNPALIIAFSADSLKVAVLIYQGGKFVCAWSGSSLAPNNEWPMSATDTFFVGTPTATPPLFTLSTQGPTNAPVPMLGAVSVATGLQLVSSATVPVQAWSPAFVAAAPKTGFTPFQSGDQPAIYTYISSLFPIPGQPGGPNQPLRTVYTNADYQGKFQPFAVALAAVPSPSQIPSYWPAHPTTWSTSDWTAVVNTIVNECNQVDTVYSLYNELGKLADAMNAFQKVDFETVTQNIKAITGNLPSEVDYWVGEVVVGALWVMAAAAGFIDNTGAAGSFAVFFTLAGSVASAAFGYEPEERETFPFDEVQSEVTETLAAAFVTQSLDLTTFLSDPVKLKLCDGLSSNEWAIPTSLPSSMQQPFQEMDRLWMYQQIVPACLTIDVESGGSNGALYSSNGTAYNFNVPLTQAEFKASAFYNDLFNTLEVSEQDFFAGNGAWTAIPRES